METNEIDQKNLATNEITFAYRDEFNRKPIAEKIIRILRSDIPISPIIIDGSWGSGKTEFCHKLINLIRNEEKSKEENPQKDKRPLTPLYLDAYKYDHSDDPFLMLITNIASLIDDQKNKADLIKKSIPVAKVLGKIAAKSAVNFVFRESANQIGKEIAETIAEGSDYAVDYGIKKLFEDFAQVDNNLQLLKKSLAQATKDKKVIVFIDELDRCKPTFALSLLEKVKHVFDIAGVQFVFTTNMQQLCAIVKQRYGSEINAENYLSKFFHFEIKLANRYILNSYYSHHNSYYSQHNGFKLFDQLAIKLLPQLEQKWTEASSLREMILYLFEEHDRSLRDAEKYFRNLQVLNALEAESSIREDNVWDCTVLIMLGVYIYTFDSDFTHKILNNQFTESDISRFWGTNKSMLAEPATRKIINTIYALFVIELPNNGYKNYIADDEQLDAWTKPISRLFSERGWGYDPKHEEGVAIVRKTLQTMQFVG